jgi:dihydropteroate synthase
MGVLNVTPDSFYDGGRFASGEHAVARAERLLADGADIVDVGAESTRPGSKPVPKEEQLRRIGDTIRSIARTGARVSIDTTDPAVARQAVDDGATMINSVSLDAAYELGAIAGAHGTDLVLMHSRGQMTSMQGFSTYPAAGYGDVVADVRAEWLAAAEQALSAGAASDRIYFDPGIGFQKNATQSLELVRRLDSFADLGFPIAVGPSRKSFISKVAQAAGQREAPPEERLGGTIAVVLAAVERGAHLVRVHDPLAVRQALALRAAIASPSVSMVEQDQDRAGPLSGQPGQRGAA